MEFPNIRYSPAWLADKFPEFYTEECYYILSNFLRENYKTIVVKQKAENLEAEQEGVNEEENNTEMDAEAIRVNVKMVYNLNSSLPSLNLSLGSNGKY